jgi:serine/threonine-protein kinase
MKKTFKGRGLIMLAVIAALVTGMLGFAGCSCSSNQPASGETYTVPDVVSLTESDARKAILASGLQVGTVTQEASDTVPMGSVVSQDPKPLTNAPANSKVNLVVSSGKAQAKDVAVPDLKGKTQADAEKALADVGLIGVASNPEVSTEVQPGQVFKQSIAAGTKVKEGTKIAFTVALAQGETTVPDVAGLTRDDAKKMITDAKLAFDSTTAYHNSVPEGKVITQSVPAGTKVKQGTTVSATISLGPAPQKDVVVPDVMTYSWADAQNAMRSAGLAVRYTGDPAGIVVAQDVAAGTKVAPNTLVTVTLSSPARYVQVPNIVGMSVSAAEHATDAVNLVLNPDGLDGTVIGQWPAAGTTVEERTTVSATVKSHDTQVVEKFLGSWQSDRPTIDFENIGSGITAKVHWGAGADESYTWEYNVVVQGEKMVCTGGGQKLHTTGGNTETVYTDGSAEFAIGKDGKLTWKDNKNDEGKGLKFEKL